MSWSVWQIGRGGAVERVGAYTTGADARRVLRSSILRGAAVDPDGEVNEARGVSPALIREIERAAETWLASAQATTMPAPAAVIEIPEPARPRIFEPLGIIREDEGEPDALAVGIGAATEPPRCRTTHHDDCDCQRDARGEPRVQPPLPVPFDAPVVAEDLSAEIERLRVQLADATARAVAAEEATAQMQAVLDAARAATAALDTRATRAEAGCAAATARADAAEGRETVLVAALRERSKELAARDRTIAKLRAELAAKAHPVVRIAAKPRRVRKAAATETPVGTLFRRIAERAGGIR